MKKYLLSVLGIVALTMTAPLFAASVNVFPSLSGTQYQTWPTAVWNASANCWLVVCEEGSLADQNKDLYCGRVSPEGVSLDPSGIPLCKAVDIQEHASVATNGTDFLVVWHDMRNGSDFDVYGARVAANGTVLDPDGFLIAGGQWNQDMASVAWAGGRYHVVWQTYSPQGVGRADTSSDSMPLGYKVWGTTVTSEGVVGTPTLLCNDASITEQPTTRSSSLQQTLLPTAVSMGDSVMVGYQQGFVFGWDNLPSLPQYESAFIFLNGTDGTRKGGNGFFVKPQTFQFGEWTFPRTAVAWGKSCGLVFIHGDQSNSFRLARFDAQGKRLQVLQAYNSEYYSTGSYRRQTIAFDGSNFMVMRDWKVADNTKFQVRAMLMSGDSLVTDTLPATIYGRMQIVSDASATTDQMLGSCAGGPVGKFLVLFSDFRGADDVKVKASVLSYNTKIENGELAISQDKPFYLYPNPFKPSLTAFIPAGSGFERVDIFDLSGRLVRTFPLKGGLGSQSIIWNGIDWHGASVSAGVYIVKCVKGTRQFLERAVLIK